MFRITYLDRKGLYRPSKPRAVRAKPGDAELGFKLYPTRKEALASLQFLPSTIYNRHMDPRP